ncbi:PREDICTED: uncharacterized protein LOC109172161 [Ipomoea nil]|uniref:uncharacterized protein LOC109172161 n=1 Tax=Ipomoea nil TaxID=35883 RepID=UPI000901E60F|nr:PREDICTED: uncharacterized protein LOC109172161 [Ipomoea nil]
MTEERMEQVRIQLGFDGKFSVDRVGLGGGIALFWRDKTVASLLSYSINHIDMEISLPGRPKWRLMGFYGEPDRTRRQFTWDLLRKLRDDSRLPWVVAGDFNDIACLSEKRGIHPHPSTLIEGFNDALNDCGLIDLGMVGGRFTWVKGRGTDAWVEERLDRAVATVDWMELHEEAVVRNIYTDSSDHCAILVDLHDRPVRAALRTFRFESAWLLEVGCATVVEEAWRISIGMSFPERIKICGNRLWQWGGEYHRQFGIRSKALRQTLANLKENRAPHAVATFLAAEKELGAIMRAKEIFWKQRSKQLWLKHGDTNTKYFHKSATARCKQNFLARIKDHNDSWTEGTAMNAAIIRYFEHIFTFGTCGANLFDRVHERVTTEMKISMSQPFTMGDVKTALFDMKPDKAPGPDSMSPAFFQHFWPVLGHDLSMFILNCVENKHFPPGLNVSNIVLIPKKSVPERVPDLCLIALCNVIYKILAKMLANRLKDCLAQVVSQSQSAFVPNRLLTDNIVVAGEIGHYLHRKTMGTQGWAALKLDMAKAYDRMEWPFLEGMLKALGFERDWVDLLMLCINSVSYSILVNGEGVGQVQPTRGIRQGDPLSPYLANEREASKIKECLDTYSLASGQLINYEKSSAIYSFNTSPAIRSVVSGLIGVPEAADLGRYLGLPSMLGRNKTEVFRYIEGNIRSRIGAWQNKLLSRAGKEVLLKSIAQALPIFTMSVFLLPMRICDTLEKLYNRYWWGGGGLNRREIHWLSWGQMCTPKSKGGLGFKKLHEFNIALLAKQGWRLLIHPESLVSRLLKARYYPTTDFMGAPLGNNPSFISRSIHAGKKVLELGIGRRVGDGRDTKIWGWDWLTGSSRVQLRTPCVEQLQEAQVHGLLNDRGCWDVDILRDIFIEEDVPRILATPVNTQLRDEWRWIGDIRGCYTVRNGYRLLTEMAAPYDITDGFHAWKTLWALPIPPKVKNLLWRCARNILPVRDNLRSKNVWIGGGCPMCGYTIESQIHIFCQCAFAELAWGVHDVLQGREFLGFPLQMISNANVEVAVHTAAVVWTIWTTRNEIVWNDKQPPGVEVREQISRLQAGWKEAYLRHSTGSALLDTWIPPPRYTIKCNVDAAMVREGASYGVVVRNHERQFVATKSGRLDNVDDPYMAEALGVREALTWLKTQNHSNIIIESDCLNFCTAFNSCNFDFSYVGLIVKQCVSIARVMGNVRVSHVMRSANRVAHALARATVSLSASGVWFDIPPTCISNVLNQ